VSITFRIEVQNQETSQQYINFQATSPRDVYQATTQQFGTAILPADFSPTEVISNQQYKQWSHIRKRISSGEIYELGRKEHQDHLSLQRIAIRLSHNFLELIEIVEKNMMQ
jgi:hypothetical protein